MPPVLDASNAASEPIKNEGSDVSRRYSCPLCPYATMTAKTVREHIQMGHTKLKAFKCSHCSYSSNYEQHLLKHLKLHGNTGAQTPIAVAPVSAEPEREMPRPQRRPLSSIGNERAVAVVPTRSASFHHTLSRRLSTAVAEAPTTADRGRSRRGQFEAEKREREKDRKEAEPVVREAKQEEGKEEQQQEQKCEDSLVEPAAGVVKWRRSVRGKKDEKEGGEGKKEGKGGGEGKEGEKADKEVAVKVEQKGVETPEPAPRARRSCRVEKEEGGKDGKDGKEEDKEVAVKVEQKGVETPEPTPRTRRSCRVEKEEGGKGEAATVERMDGKRRTRKSVEEKREEVVDEKVPPMSSVQEEQREVKKEEEEPVERKEVKRPGRKSAEKKKKEQKASLEKEEEKMDEVVDEKPPQVNSAQEEQREVKKEEEEEPVERKEVKRPGRKSADKKKEQKASVEKEDEVVDEKQLQVSSVQEEQGEVTKEEEEPVERKEVKRPGRKSAEQKMKERKASVEKEEEKRPVRQARLSAEKSAEEREGRGEDSGIRSSDARKRRNSSASAEEKAGETGRKKRGRRSFAEIEERMRREEAEHRSTATVEVKREAMEQAGEGERSELKEEEREDEMLDISALDAAIAEAEANAARERVRPAMPALERKREAREEEGPSTRKRVHFAPLPEKHHARHMPAKRRRREGEREGDAMRNRVARDLSSFFSSFDAPASARSISSPDRSGRRATIIEAMKARTSQLEQKEDEEAMEEEAATAEIKLPFSAIPFESPVVVVRPLQQQQQQPIDEFESSDDDEDTVAVPPPPPVKPVRKTPAKARKPSGATVSPRTTVSPNEAGRKKTSKSTPAKNAREVAARARAAATAARKREQARAARIRRLKREVARRLAKSADRWNLAARTMVEEEDRYWRTAIEVTPLEQKEWSGERRLFSWPEIHNARRKLAIDVEPVRAEGERRPETLHAISTSTYLARAVELKQRCEIDGIVKIVKSFDRARSPPLDWSYEEKETEDALHPTVPSEFVPGGRLRCL